MVAGTDSSGGAGIAADLHAADAYGVRARLAITCVTTQTDHGVERIDAIPIDGIVAQIRAALPYVAAIKVGMVGSSDAALAIGEAVRTFDGPVVFDPVLRASSGGQLIDGDLEGVRTLARRATLYTPNAAEHEALGAVDSLRLVTGGDLPGIIVTDRLVWPQTGQVHVLTANRIEGTFRGTGCRLATAIAIELTRTHDVVDAVGHAMAWLRGDLLKQAARA